ncbi:MAG: DEAD/DEAH box helicase family protein [Alphaproteobacteria bacterium]
MTTIEYVSGLCASGKTTAAEEVICRRVRAGENVLVVVPSVELGEEIEKALRALDPGLPVFRFDRDTQGRGMVMRKLMEHLIHTTQGQVVITTQASFFGLQHFHRREDWHVIIDEVPAGHEGRQLNLPETYRVITDYIDVVEDERSNMVYHSVYAKNRGRLQEYIANPRGDEVWKMLAPVAEAILSDHWNVSVEAGSYWSIQDQASREGRHALYFYSDLSPSVLDGFKSVTMMGALFTDSILYRLWSNQGVEFVENREIVSQLQFREHQNGHRLRILWGFDATWTKSFQVREIPLRDGSKRPAWNALVDATRVELQRLGQPALYVGNKDRMDHLRVAFKDLDAVELPHSPYGFNKYQGRHVAAVLPALNPAPHVYGYLWRYGIDSDDVRAWIYRQWVYQAANRTSLRNPDATATATVIVADHDTAEWLAKLYPGCTVDSLGIDIDTEAQAEGKARPGRPCTGNALSPAERQRRRRERIAGAMLDQKQVNPKAKAGESAVTNISTRYSNNGDSGLAGAAGLDEPVVWYQPGEAVPTHGMDSVELSLYGSIYSTDRNVIRVANAEYFIAELRSLHRVVVDAKHRDNVLLNTTVFDPTLSPDTARGLANIVYIWGIWLDIDDGEMPPDFIPRHILPTTRMVVYNSHSGGNSYRVFIPTKQRMHIRSYAEIVRQIVQEVEQAGYVGKRQRSKTKPLHGIDASKYTPNSLFYLPCQARDPAESFFEDWNQTRRTLLDVDAYVERSVYRSPEEFETWEPDPVEIEELRQHAREAKGDRIAEFVLRYTGEYQSIPDGAGRHAGFFRLAWRLHYACGIGFNDLEPYLWAADYDRSRTAGDVKSILKSLSSGRYRPHWYLDRLRPAA